MGVVRMGDIGQKFFQFSKIFDFFESVQKVSKWSKKYLKCAKNVIFSCFMSPALLVGVPWRGPGMEIMVAQGGVPGKIFNFRKFSIFLKVSKKCLNGLQSISDAPKSDL